MARSAVKPNRATRFNTQVRETRVEETQQYSTLPCGRVVVQTHQVMVDTPYGDCFAVLTKWVFEPPDTTAAAASGGCSVSVSAELVWFKDTWLKKQISGGAIEEINRCYEVPPSRSPCPS